MAMRKAIRWVVLVVVAVIIALVVVLGGVIMETGEQGSSDIEVYIGEQIRGVVNAYLKPQLEFTKPDYQYPKTVTIENVRITAIDPMRDGRSVDIVRVRRATLELAEIPTIGEPLQIEKVTLDKPELRLLAMGNDDASLIGFSDLLKDSGPTTAVDATTPSTTKLTDVFRIRLIQLMGGVIEYDPRTESGKAMRLDNINTKLEVEPSDDGWYELRTSIARDPVLSIDIDGRFNINDAIAKIKSLDVKMDLGAEANKTLPPQLQEFLGAYQLQGALTLAASGELNFNDLTQTKLLVDADLRQGYATFDQYRIKIDKLLAKAEMAEQAIDLKHFELRALNGYAFATGNVALTGEQNATIQFEAEGLDLSGLDRALAESQAPSEASSESAASATGGTSSTPAAAPASDSKKSPLRGTLKAKFNLAAPLESLMSKAGGGGYVTLKDGRLVRVPVLKELESAVSTATNVFSGSKPSDQLHVEFKLDGDHAKVEKLDLRTPAMAVRGSGTVHFDGKLDFSLNGGPLEKVQNLFGKLGEITSQITDRLAQYRVTGTVQKPEFGIKVAPGLFDGLIPKSKE